MPHRRIILSALAYAATLALLIAGLAVVSLLEMYTSPPTGPPDDAPIRGAVSMLLITPVAFAVALAFSVPVTYICWKRRPISKRSVAKLIAASAIAPSLPGAYLVAGLSVSPVPEFLAAAIAMALCAGVVFGAPAVVWWMVAPRALTNR